jgi:hypothetical protein
MAEMTLEQKVRSLARASRHYRKGVRHLVEDEGLEPEELDERVAVAEAELDEQEKAAEKQRARKLRKQAAMAKF